MRKKNKPTRI